MKSLSSYKKKKSLQYDTPKYIQSKLYLSSTGNNNLNPLSQSIASKLNIIKQEISRQFNQKYTQKLIDRKLKCMSRCDSLKRSTSVSRVVSRKSKSKQCLIQPVRLFQDQNQNSNLTNNNFHNFHNFSSNAIESQQYLNKSTTKIKTKNKSVSSTAQKQKQRKQKDKYDKYQQMNLKFFNQKNQNNSIQDRQRLISMKNATQNFFLNPSQNTANSLVALLNSLSFISEQLKLQDKKAFMESLHNIIESKQQFDFLKDAMQRMLSLTKTSSIQQLQNLLTQLKRGQGQCRFPSSSNNVDHLSYRILQLEANNNRLKNQYENIIKDIQQKYELMLLEEKQQREKQSNQFNFLISRLQSQIQQYSIRQNHIQSDLYKLYEHYATRPLQQKSLKFIQCEQTFTQNKFTSQNKQSHNSSMTSMQFKTNPLPESLQQIQQLLKQMSEKLSQIRIQAEQNMQKFQQSNKQINSLDTKLRDLVIQMQEQINEGIKSKQQKDMQLQKQKERTDKIQKQLNQLNQRLSQKEKQITTLQDKLKQKQSYVSQNELLIAAKDKQSEQFKRLWQIENSKVQINLRERQSQTFRLKASIEELKTYNDELKTRVQKFYEQKSSLWNLLKQFQTFFTIINQSRHINANKSKQSEKQKTSIKKNQLTSNKMKSQIQTQFLCQYLKLKIQNYKNQYKKLVYQIEQKQVKVSKYQEQLNKFSDSIQNFYQENQILKKQYKSAKIQKQEYQFLLKNTRQEFRLAKKKYQSQMKKLQREKDEELLVSNKTILEANSALTHQNIEVKAQNQRLNRLLQQNINERTFYKKKTHQSDANLIQKQQKISELQKQIMKYKATLDQIQQSFNQVVKNEQISSQKLINLQQQKISIAQQIKLLQQTNESLQKQNDEYRAKFNSQVMKTQSLQAKIQDLILHKQKYQQVNIELRMSVIQAKQQKETFEEQNKHLKRDKLNLQQQNSGKNVQYNKIMKQLADKSSQLEEAKQLQHQLQKKQQKLNIFKQKCEKLQTQAKQNTRIIEQLQLQLQYQEERSKKSKNQKQTELQRNIKDLSHQKSIYNDKLVQIQNIEKEAVKKYQKLESQRLLMNFQQSQLRQKQLIAKQQEEKSNVRYELIRKQQKRLLQFQSQLTNKEIQIKNRENIAKDKQIQYQHLSRQLQNVGKTSYCQQECQTEQIQLQTFSTEKNEESSMTQLTNAQIQSQTKQSNLKLIQCSQKLQNAEQQIQKLLQNENYYKQKQIQSQKQKQFFTKILTSFQERQSRLAQVETKIKNMQEQLQSKQNRLIERQQKIDQNKKEIIEHLKILEKKGKQIEGLKRNKIKLVQFIKKNMQNIKQLKLANTQNKSYLQKMQEGIKTQYQKSIEQLVLLIQKNRHLYQNQSSTVYKVYEPLIEKDFYFQQNNNNNNQNTSIQHKKITTSDQQFHYSPHNIAQIYSGKILSIPSQQQNQIQNQNIAAKINQVLELLIDNIEDPQIPIFQSIRLNYNILRKKIKITLPPLQLDISSVQHKGSLCSPNSTSFCKDFLFDRRVISARVNTQPQQILLHDQNASERGSQLRKTDKSQTMHLKKFNDYLQEVMKQLQQKNQYLKNKNLQLQQKVVLLQNHTSIKALQNSLLKLIDSYIQDNVELFQQTCRLIMKLLHFPQTEIEKKEEEFIKRKKKKGSSKFFTFFK